MANPPGINVSVNASSASSAVGAPTGTWFAAGVAAGGPTGVAIPVTSLQDFENYFGIFSNGTVTGRTPESALLYDSLDVYFREGGVRAYVSRAVKGESTGTAAAWDLGTNFVHFTSRGVGSWVNSASGSPAGLVLVVAGSGPITIAPFFNGAQINPTSPALVTAQDVVDWVTSLGNVGLGALVTASALTGSVTLPTASAHYVTGGADGDSATAGSSDLLAALDVFGPELGVGQISVPGSTDYDVAVGVVAAASANNRVAILDAVDAALATDLVANIQDIQGGILSSDPAGDPSYGGTFGPWAKVPGIASTSPQTVAPVFSRTVPPSAFVAAKCAAIDVNNDSNVPAAGIVNGACAYASDVTTAYSASDRAALNAAGVNIIRNISGTVAVYGFRSMAIDPNWTALNNVRFRMQIINDFDVLAEPFVFAEIDGKGHVFARLAGVLSGKCQQYWLNGSLYGPTASSAFSVNTGGQINTNATIAAGEINGAADVRMSPQAELVNIKVTKYLASQPLPTY